MRFLILATLAALSFAPDAYAGPLRRRATYESCTTGTCSASGATTLTTSESYRGPAALAPATLAAAHATPAGNACADALHEVNALRAARGLPPYANDPALAAGALACAQARAASLSFGHTRNDFQYLPAGASASAAGCAAYADGYGWMSCAVYDRATYAGAAWVRGADGRRFMHLFIR